MILTFTDDQKANIKLLMTASKGCPLAFQAALFGITGCECEWMPQEESCHYTSKDRIKAIFSFLSDSEAESLVGCTDKAHFFSVVYGPTHRGAGFLGNLSDEDAGKFFGRGFIQLTGRGNYQKFSTICGIDFMTKPELMNEPESAAKAAVAFLKQGLKPVMPNDPALYFEALH